MTELDDHIDTDAGPHRTGPQRLCAVTRTVKPVDELIRFVAGPDGVVPDLRRKLPGRGIWISARRQVVAEALKRGIFRRGLKADVKVPSDLPAMVERLLVRAALGGLSIAYKAGQVAVGFAKAENAIEQGAVVGLIHAAEAGHDGPRKLAAVLNRSRFGDQKVTIVRGFTSAELDLALGRANVVHAALLAGRASETFLARWQDLEHFRTAENDGDRRVEIAGSPAAMTELELG